MMRNKLIALLLMMTLSLSITAQKTISNNEKVYIPMLSDGNSWKYHFMVDYQEKLMDEWFLYSISSTFTKNGETYYKMYVFLSTNDVNAKTSVSTKSSLFPTLNLREKDRKVLVDRKEYLAFLEGENGYNIPIFGDKNYLPYPVTSDDEIVLYDFNMNVGDKFISVEGHEDISVVKVDTIESFENRPSDKSLPRKWITLSNGMVIVEGVGCINSAGGLLSYLNPLQDTEEQSMNVVSGEIDYTYLNVDNSEDERDDYKPFVEIGYSYEPCKRWRVIHTMPGEMTHSTFTHSWLSDNYYFDNYQLENEKTVRGDNTYFNMRCYGSGPVKGHLRMPDPSRENVLLREKDRKVYVYSEKDQKEYLLYDFSLKEGDAFTSYDIDAGETVNLKVLSVGQLDDGPRVFPYNKTSEDGKEEEKRPLKTWTIGIEIESDVYPAEYQEIFTLIEGVGCNEGPFFNYDKSKGCDYLAFVIGPESYCAYPLIFPFFNTQYASVRGCKMLTGDEVSHNWDGDNELTCELVDGQLHVYGNVWLGCASYYYAYFMEEPTEDPMVHILRFYSDISSLYVATCEGKYQTDFWVPGFGPGDNEYAPEGYDPSKIQYIVVDKYGNEFPVINKTQEDEYEIDDDDYIPFVVPGVVVEPGFEEPGKSWYVVHTKPGENPNFMDYSMWLSDNYNFNKYYLSSTEIVRDGNIYYKMNGYLLREKDRKVYVYSEDDQKEYLLYDFSLKEGDTFTSYDVYSGKTMNLKVLKEGWLTDGPRVFQSDKTMTYEELKEHKRPLRTWLIGREMETDVYPPEYEELFTLIEGVGCNEGPFFSYDKTNGCDYLAYLQAERPIETNQGTEYLYDDLSFPILNTRFANVHGFEMQTGEKSNTEPTDWPIRHELTFELEDGQLHGYGYAYTVCCGNDYAYIIETPTENPLVHLLHFKIDVSSSNYCDCTAWHKTDFWVSGFGPGDNEYAPEGYDPSKIEYIVVDENGNEYPVINKQTQTTTYRPFIEEDKVWKVGVTDSLHWSIDNPVEKIEYFYFDGDTIIDGKVCKRMMERDYTKENSSNIDYNDASLTYVGAWYENGHKVYFAAPNKPLRLMYDFSVSEGDTVRMDGIEFTFIKTVGDINGFKGVCYKLHVPTVKVYIIGMETLLLNVWLEGVGSATRPDINMDLDFWYLNKNLLSCSVGDEIIYLNDKYDDIIPLDPETPKRRIDFTHTVKVKPKAPVRRTNEETEESLIGEYNDRQLYIRLGDLRDAFIVTIKDRNDSVVYTKSVRTNEIVALDIDISDYTDGDYSVCMENDEEAFNGMFTIEPTAIHYVMAEQKGRSDNAVYDLTGRPVSKDRLSRGIYIQNGRKVLVR